MLNPNLNQFSQNKKVTIFASHKRLLFVMLMFSLVFSCILLANAADDFPLETPINVGNERMLFEAIDNAGTGVPVVISFTGSIHLSTSLRIPAYKDITLVSNGDEFFELIGPFNQDTIIVENHGTLNLVGIIVTHITGAAGRGVTVNSGGTLVLSDDGVISGNDVISSNGGGVYNAGTFTMHGGVISGNATHSAGGGYYSGGGVCNDGGVFEMFGGVISNNTASSGGVLNYRGVFRMFGGVISNNTASSGGGVYNRDVFEMFGGVISCHTTGSGGGVYSGSVFRMFGGVISDNTVTNSGGVWASNVFEMFGGLISGNTAHYGGGVYADSGSFSLSGGEISGNCISGSSGNYGGGGVYVYRATFTMTDGVISNNRATIGDSYSIGNGGGLYIDSTATVDLVGGVISGNTAGMNGGGVWIAQSGFDRLFVRADMVFERNHASATYDRHIVHDYVYSTNVFTDAWTAPLLQGYNNYDISYTFDNLKRTSYTVTVHDSYAEFPGTGSYIVDEYVTINAGDRDDFEFSGWTVNDGDLSFLIDAAQVTFRMPAINVDITANWKSISEFIGIEVIELPLKTVYAEGELLDLTGLVVTATYSDESTKIVKDYTTNPVTGEALNEVGIQTVTISYTERDVTKACSFDVTVNSVHEHVFVGVVTESSCTERGFTTYTCGCGESYVGDFVDALGHVEGVGVVTKEPTYTEEGEWSFFCDRCGELLRTEVIPVLPPVHEHVFVGVVTESSCTERGFTTYTCGCGESYKTDYTAELGHNYVGVVITPATCTSVGSIVYVCLRCTDYYFDSIEMLSHDFVAEAVVEPICDAEGYTVYVCSVCGETRQGDFVPALCHNYVGVVVTPATCSSEGVIVYVCLRCTDYYFDSIEMLPHDLIKEVVVAATCTVDGLVVIRCSCCDFETVEVLPALGHDYGAVVTVVSACEEVGLRLYTCSCCGDSYLEVSVKLGHVFSDGVYTWPMYGKDVFWTFTCYVCDVIPVEVNEASILVVLQKHVSADLFVVLEGLFDRFVPVLTK